MTENKRFQYNVNKNCIEYDGNFVAYVNSIDGFRIANKLNCLEKENENLKNALWEAEEEYLYEAYHDNPIRLQDKIMGLKIDWDKEYWNDS